MVDRIIHSGGIIICEEQYMIAMRAIQAENDADRTGHAGYAVPILPMWPQEQKYARVKYCERCELIVLARSDQIPPEDIPDVAK